jgi:hypothetical protein
VTFLPGLVGRSGLELLMVEGLGIGAVTEFDVALE